MESTTVVEYVDGWISVTGPATELTVTEALDLARTSPLQVEYEPGQVQVGPSGEPPDHLTALDGETGLPMTLQLREFYGYARWWRGSVLLSEIPDPGEYLDLLTDPRVDLPGVLAAEFTPPGVLADARGRGLEPTRCALLMVDTMTASPYQRPCFRFDEEQDRVRATVTPCMPRSGGDEDERAPVGETEYRGHRTGSVEQELRRGNEARPVAVAGLAAQLVNEDAGPAELRGLPALAGEVPAVAEEHQAAILLLAERDPVRCGEPRRGRTGVIPRAPRLPGRQGTAGGIHRRRLPR